MKRSLFLSPAVLLIASCVSVSGVVDGAFDKAAGSLSDSLGNSGASSASKAPRPAGPGSLEPTEENVVAAVKACDVESLEKILADVDDVRTIVGDDVLLLHMAEEAAGINGLENPVAKILVEKKAYVLQRDGNGKSWERIVQDMELAATPRHEYIRSVVGDKFQRRMEAIRADDVDAYREFEEYGPNDGKTLWEAVDAKAADVVIHMLDRGADVGYRTGNTGEGVLHASFRHMSSRTFSDVEGMVAALLEAGADPDAADKHGHTPMYLLATTDCADNPDVLGDPAPLFRLLLEAGADPNPADSTGWTAMDKMIGNTNFPNPGVVEMMLDHGCEISRITRNTCPGDMELVRLLVEHGADARAMARQPRNFEDGAEQADYYRYLLSKGAAIGDFDLRMSVIHPENMRFLLEMGADPNARYSHGTTALHSAARNGYGETASVLLAAGADANIRRDDGQTPLDLVRSADERTASVLRAAGGKKSAEL